MLSTRAARRLLGLLLASSLALPHCKDDAQAPTPPIQVVLGTESQCASRLRFLRLVLVDGASRSTLLDEEIKQVGDLPLQTYVDLPAAGGQPVQLVAIFTVENGPLLVEMRQKLTLPAGSSGRISIVLPCVCMGVSCEAEASCAEVPRGSGQALCVDERLCGDGKCSLGEDAPLCPVDCPVECGDGKCSPGESCSKCASDCGLCPGQGGAGAAGKGGAGGQGASGTAGGGKGGASAAGAGQAGASGAGQAGAAGEPAAVCGDGACNGNETKCKCAEDCGAPGCGECGIGCGDGKCNCDETACDCPGDCGKPACGECGKGCGDGKCNCGESNCDCPEDCGDPGCGECGIGCGDGKCNCGESKCDCPQDCGAPAACECSACECTPGVIQFCDIDDPKACNGMGGLCPGKQVCSSQGSWGPCTKAPGQCSC